MGRCTHQMAELEHPSSLHLPDKLRRQFADLEHRLWSLETTAAVCSALVGLILSYLLLFVSDRIWDTPVGLRMIITLAGVGVGLVSGWRWAWVWVWHRRDQRALANLVQKRFRRLGDRLLGIVELADEKQRPPNFSPALYRAAIRQVATDAAQYDFCDAVRSRFAKMQAGVLLGLVLVVALPLWLVPAAVRNTFQRWIAPSASIGRYTLVQLEGVPARRIVPHGEPFTVEFSVQYRSFWRPAQARSQYERQPRLEASIRDGRVRFQVPGQVRPGVLKIRVGDAIESVAIAPTHRPALRGISAAIQWPDYLEYPRQEEKIQNGSLAVLEGSRISFHGQANRPLASAELRTQGQAPQTLTVRAESFSSDPLNTDGIHQFGFTWKDELGLESVAPWPVSIQPQKDSPPTPEFLDLSREIAILESEVLQLKTAGRDDFGVRELGLVWAMVSEMSSTNSPPQIFRMQAPTSQEKRLETTFRLSPTLLRIPADSAIELRAYAKDSFPGREPSLTPLYRISVLGNERHAELVRQKLESLLARLEEVTRLEEKVAESTRELKELTKEDMATEKARERVGQAKEEQNQTAAQLEELAKEGAKTLREAFRNPTMPEKTLRDWAKNIQEMQELSQQKMQEAAQALKSAEQNKESRSGELAKASEKQDEILQDLQQIQKKVNQGLDDLQALTLAQRLRKVATEEKDIAAQLQKNIPATIGLPAKDLPARYQKVNGFLSGDQEAAQKESQALQGEISRFFERTRQENYGQVSTEMTTAKPAEEMDKVRGLISENISMEAMQQLAAWSERFTGWADILEPKKEGGGSGGGGSGEGGNQFNQLLNQLLSLLRLREGEINVRDRTLLLDQQKEEATRYAEGAKALYGAQRKHLKTVLDLQIHNQFPPLIEPFKEINESMQDVGSLLGEPQTGPPTQVAENKAVDVLSDVINLINEQAKQGGSQQMASQQQMAFLLQMMAPEPGQSQGMAVGRNAGQSSAGGTTDRPAAPLEGDARGQGAEARNVNKASGVIGNLPTEFRDALEDYFNAIEKDGN